jgi:hypothetical protein
LKTPVAKVLPRFLLRVPHWLEKFAFLIEGLAAGLLTALVAIRIIREKTQELERILLEPQGWLAVLLVCGIALLAMAGMFARRRNATRLQAKKQFVSESSYFAYIWNYLLRSLEGTLRVLVRLQIVGGEPVAAPDRHFQVLGALDQKGGKPATYIFAVDLAQIEELGLTALGAFLDRYAEVANVRITLLDAKNSTRWGTRDTFNRVLCFLGDGDEVLCHKRNSSGQFKCGQRVWDRKGMERSEDEYSRFLAASKDIKDFFDSR